jgi:hypothetical protein
MEATLDVTNATLADDPVLRESLMIELECVLEELRCQHGDHPILLETAADFQDMPRKRVDLYRSALDLAERNNLPTLSIRISLARVLLEYFGDPRAAAHELAACRNELRTNADQSDLEEWSELLSKCREQ